MKIAFGRRQLVVSVESTCCDAQSDPFPMAINATDAELARLNVMRHVAIDRARWDTNAILYGAVRLRST